MKNKKNWLLKYLTFIIVTFIIVSVIYYVLEKTGNGNIVKIIVVIAAAGSIFFKLRGKPSSVVYEKYEAAYADFISGAFTDDKKNRKKLVEACIYWDSERFDKAHKLLDELLEKCTCARDYQIVYRVKSICYAREGRNEPLVDTYKKLLEYDVNDTATWASLGWIYLQLGKTKEAGETFHTALKYGNENGLLYNNMATYYMKIGEPEKALEAALKAAELAPNMYQPMSTAAIACKMLGDEEGAAYYSRLYVEKGGTPGRL